ncbi:MAG TPA: hypothetical protein VJ719_11715, partial [Chthoniobacterales bacterium]|nr:hypothetical protein [Chthoniobacterales bacterium]
IRPDAFGHGHGFEWGFGILGSAGASPAVSGASPEISEQVRYSKRRLPHFERPWSKYAVTFSTRDRLELSPNERDIVLNGILVALFVSPDENYPWPWTPEVGPARAPNRAGEAPALPGTASSARGPLMISRLPKFT